MDHNDYNFQYIKDKTKARAGKYYQRFELRDGDCFRDDFWSDCDTDRERVEFSTEPRQAPKGKQCYGYSLMLSKDFIFITPAHNFRTTEINAVLGLSQLPKLDVQNQNRVKNFNHFIKNIDSSFAIRKSFYLKRKAEIGWDENFDLVAKASLNFHHITKKEIYPYAHQFRTGENIRTSLPKDYYNHRKEVDFNNAVLTNYSPYIKYVSVMLNNVALQSNEEDLNENSLDNNITKLNILFILYMI